MKVPAKGTPLRQRMIEDMGIRNLSPATQYNYVNCVAKYALHFGKSPAVLGPEHIRGYQVHLTQVKRVSWSVFNTAVCALRFLYRITLQKDWAVEHIPYPKKPKRLPEVLSLDEVWRFLEFITNLKYRALLMTAYASGLRTSEVVKLRVKDIDSARRSSEWSRERDKRTGTPFCLRSFCMSCDSIGRPSALRGSGSFPDGGQVRT